MPGHGEEGPPFAHSETNNTEDPDKDLDDNLA